MFRLNIITPTAARDIQLLPKMVESCKTNLFDVKLWIGYDYIPENFFDLNWINERIKIDPTSFKGKHQRNSIINDIPEHEWICYQDSDSIVHPDFFKHIKYHIESNPNINCFFFEQDRMDGNILLSDNPGPCTIDGHQVVYRNNKLLWTDEPAADGILLKQIFDSYKTTTKFIPEILCYHNFLVNGAIQ